MVFAVQCPNSKCRKYMLVEDMERGKVVACLLCKAAIKVGGSPTQVSSQATPQAPLQGSPQVPPPVRTRPARKPPA